MAITNGTIQREAAVKAGLNVRAKIADYATVFNTASNYVIGKWVSGKSAYEKDIATQNDATTGLDQIKSNFVRNMAKKTGSTMFVKSGVTKPMLITAGKSYLFDLTQGAQETDFQNLEVALANKIANDVASFKLQSKKLSMKKMTKNKIEAAKTTANNTLSAALASLNS